MTSLCIVLKDRSWKVNGLGFVWKDHSGYRKGEYRLVYKTFEPYFRFLSMGGEHHAISAERNSDEMFRDNNGDSAYYHKQRVKTATLEDWSAGMELMKRNRAVVGEAITGVRSQTSLEQYDVNQLQQCVGILMCLKQRMKLEPPAMEDDLLRQVQAAKEGLPRQASSHPAGGSPAAECGPGGQCERQTGGNSGTLLNRCPTKLDPIP